MHLAWSHKSYMHFFASYGATTGVIYIRSFSSFYRSLSSNLGDWEFKNWLLFFQPWFELWKWQRDFFDKWCNTTAAQTLQWLLNFDWLLILYNCCIVSFISFSAYYNLPNSLFWPAKCLTVPNRVIIILLIYNNTPQNNMH